ncbi:decarboxylase [Streptomyces viridosporus]|uniref:decarboxylase n=1 Tax=Streptomyces viridosporus TaxID=67581 RepID=UPI003702EEB5
MTTLAPERTVVNTAVPAVRRVRGKGTHREGVNGGRRAAVRGRHGAADVRSPSCADLPTPALIPRPEAEFRIPVISANQVTGWAALRRLGTRAVGPYQALVDVTARSGTALPGQVSGAVVPEKEKQQEGWS